MGILISGGGADNWVFLKALGLFFFFSRLQHPLSLVLCV